MSEESKSIITPQALQELEQLQDRINSANSWLGSIGYNYKQSKNPKNSQTYKDIYRKNAEDDVKKFETELKFIMNSEHALSYEPITTGIADLIAKYLQLPTECPNIVTIDSQRQAMSAYLDYDGLKVLKGPQKIELYRRSIRPEEVRDESGRKNLIRELYLQCEMAYGDAEDRKFRTARGIEYIGKILEPLKWPNAICGEFVIFSDDDTVNHEFDIKTLEELDFELERFVG